MFLASEFFGGQPLNFWTWIIKFSQLLIMWQSFRAIGRGTLENMRGEKRKTNICGKTEALLYYRTSGLMRTT